MSTENPNTVVDGSGVLLQDMTVGGVTYAKGSTAVQRSQAIAKSMEAGTFAPSHNGAGPPIAYQTHATQQRLASGEKSTAAGTIAGTIAGKAPPPSPKELEAANKPQGDPSPQRQAELQAKGLQKRPDGTVHADGRGDPEAIELLTVGYREHLKNARTEQARTDLRAAFERDYVRLSNGRPVSELELGLARGQIARQMEAAKNINPAEPAAATEGTAAGWEQAHHSAGGIDERGFLDMRSINPKALSGYTLPVFLENQVAHRSVFARLETARAAGVTQAQVDSYLRAELVAAGKLKA